MRPALALVAAALCAAAWAAPPSTDPLASRLVGRRCLLFRYVGSDRNVTIEDDTRRPVTTILEGSRIRYVASWKLGGIPIEASKQLKPEELAWYDSRLHDRPSFKGFEPGEVVAVTEVDHKDDEVEIKVAGTGFRRGPVKDERKGKLLFKLPNRSVTTAEILESVWRVLLPEPPYASDDEVARAMTSVVHFMPLSALAEWMRQPAEETIRRVAERSLDLSGLGVAEREAVRACYEGSYLSLSDRAGLALLRIGLAKEVEGTALTVEGRPHLPLLGDWPSEGARAEAAFDWAAAKILRTLPRKWSGLPLAGYRVTVEYEFRGREGWGQDKLVSLVPAPVAADYADLKISTRVMAGRSEHRLNGLPLSLGQKE